MKWLRARHPGTMPGTQYDRPTRLHCAGIERPRRYPPQQLLTPTAL